MSPQKKKDQVISNTAITTGGAGVAGTGLVAGGVPGAKSDVSDVKYKGGKTVREKVRGRAKQVKAMPGGVFGFRQNSHEGGIYGFKQKNTANEWSGPPTSSADAYRRGRDAGKIAPEEHILRHLKGGKKAAGVALVGGTATAAYGAHRTKKERIGKAERHSDKWNAGLAAGGATAAGISHGTTKLLTSQERKWAGRASKDIDEAGKLVPAIAGRVARKKYTKKDIKRGVPRRTMHARVPDDEIKRSPDLFKDVSHETAEKAGKLRGAAAQHAHFAEVYGDTAKLIRRGRAPGLVAAGAGTGGLLATRLRDEKVKKRAVMSDAELRRRKKLQGHISQTTSTLGLGGLGITGAAALAARKPGVLRQVKKLPGLKNTTPEKMKNTAINTGIVSGGIGGVGGYNFAAYTNAESRKRQQPKTLASKGLGMDMGYYGDEGNPVEIPEIAVPIEKAWEPQASNFDSEGSRKKRAKAYEGAALVGAGAGGAYAGHQGVKAVGHARQIKTIPEASPTATTKTEVKTKKGKHVRTGSKITGASFKALNAEPVHGALKHGGKALLGVGAVGAAAGAHKAIKRKRKGDWQPYAKRDAVSAFGVDHLVVSEESTW